MIEGLVDRLKAEIGSAVTVVATGGMATLFDSRTDVFDAIEPDLTIQGLARLASQA
jgi:type III pantothenate kinase